MRHLTEAFLLELFKLYFKKKSVIELCIVHLEYHYLPLDSYKELWKSIKLYYQTKKELPTYGIISQQFDMRKKEDRNILSLINKVKETKYPKDESNLIKELEEFIKDAISVDFFNKFEDTYNKGDRDKAKKLLIDTARKINDFSLSRDIKTFTKVFGGYLERYGNKKYENKEEKFKERTIFGIDELDRHYGVDIGDIFCFIAQSGVGKTKLLRWIGMCNALIGFKVLHIQLEGTKKKCEEGYDATLSGMNIKKIEKGEVSDDVLEILKSTIDNVIIGGGEIYIEAFEEFGTFSLINLREMIMAFEKEVGEVPDLVLIDYIDPEILDPGDGKQYAVSQEKQKLQAIGRGIKNLAMEFKTRIGTAYQASDVSIDSLNDPSFVLTRHHTKGDKNMVSPFSFVHTLNQTKDEYLEGTMRLFEDKVRDYRGKRIYFIGQNYDNERFYDRKKTVERQKDYQNS